MRRLARPAAAGGILRRPAAQPDAKRRARRGGAEVEGPQERYQRGDSVVGVEVAPGGFSRGDWLVAEEGIYFQKKVQAAGKVEREEIEGGEREVVVSLTGTSSEELLRFATAHRPCLVRWHLCTTECDQLRENPNLLHIRKLKRVAATSPKTWENNLIEEGDTPALREEEERWRREKEVEEKKKKKKRSSSSSRSRSRRKKKKKKKKEVRAGQGEGTAPVRMKLGGKTTAKKSLEALFLGTGLDPDPKNRKRLLRKVKQKLKKAKDTSSSSSSTSSEDSSEVQEGLLQDRSKVHRIASMAPGVLAAQGIGNMQQYLVRVTGSGWEEGGSQLPPLLSLYNRTYVTHRLTGGTNREYTTLSWIGDLMLQGKVAESMDAIMQRLKSIELTASGMAWSTAQKIEIVPSPEAAISSRQEMHLAKKEAKLDSEAKAPAAGSEKGKGKTKDKGKEKGKEKGKGKPKETEAKK